MPIVDPEVQTQLVEQPTTVRIAAPQYKGVVVDTRYIPSTALLTNIEGSAWTVQYYSQVLNDDSATSGQNVTLDAIYQQYRMLKGFEFKVTSPLTTAQDDATKTMTLTGTANVYPFLIPNVGDMFLADIGDGREGVFKITRSERRSIFKDTCHVVDYQLIDYSTPMLRGDLNSKVVQVLQFVKDFSMHGQNPLLQEEDYAVVQELQKWYYELAQRYFRAFTSNEFKTLLVPAQPQPVYDHFLTKAMTSYFSTWDASELRHIRRLNVDGDDAMKSTILWEALANRDGKLIRHAAQRSGLISTRTFEKNPMMEGIYYSGIPYVVYPKDPELSVDYEFTKNTKTVADKTLVDSPSRVATIQDLLGLTTLNGLPYDGSPLIHPVMVDDFYVLSQAFYDNVRNAQSRLELCVRDYLDDKALNNKLLLAFCQTCHAWGGLERFYYIPIVLILIKASIRSV